MVQNLLKVSESTVFLKPPWILCRHFSNHTTTAKGPDHHHPEWGALAYYRGPASEWLLCRHTRGGAMAKENPATFPKKRTWDSRGASDIGLSHGCGKHQRLFFFNGLFLWREWHWQKWTTIWSSAHNKAPEKGHPALVRPNKSIKSLSCSRSITVALMTQTAKTSAK